MEVLVNSLSIEANEYDDKDMILKKYALTQDSSSLPKYYKISSYHTSPDGNKITIQVKDIRDKLKSKINKLTKEYISKLLKDYPLVTKYDIGMLWLIKHKIPLKEIPSDILQVLRKLDSIKFTSNMSRQGEAYMTHVRQLRSKIEKNIRDVNRIVNKISAIDSTIGYSEFKASDIDLKMRLKIGTTGGGLMDIFDSMRVSEVAPFILYKKEKSVYQIEEEQIYKLYQFMDIPDKWINYMPDKEGIYVKILHAPLIKLQSTSLMMENLFSELYIEPDGSGGFNTSLSYSITYNITEEEIMQRVSSVFKGLDHDFAHIEQDGIKGSYEIKRFDINRVIFSDMIMTDKLVSYCLFVNERQKPVMEKKRFDIYMKLGYNTQNDEVNVKDTVKITLSPYIKDKISIVEVSLTRLKNVRHAQMLQSLFSKLLQHYINKKDEIIKAYAELIPNFKVKFIESTKYLKNKTKKTGGKSDTLREKRPEVFIKGYPIICQQKKQPNILNEDEVDTFRKQYGANKMLKWDDLWFTCDQDAGNQFKHIGLQKNTKLPNKDQYPVLPCCFEDDQYAKKASKLQTAGTSKTDDYISDDNHMDISYIKKAGKQLDIGRVGMLPYDIESMFNVLGVPNITYKTNKIPNILTYGVMEGPDSFIHCMERVFNKKYSMMTIDGRKDSVRSVREKLAAIPHKNLGVGRQEIYDIPNTEVAAYLKLPSSYINPDIFIQYIEYHYNCNVFLFEENETYPNGNVVIPKSSEAYLYPTKDMSKPAVYVLKMSTNYKDYSYTCVLLVQIPKEIGSSLNFKHTDILLNERVNDIFKKSNEVYQFNGGRIMAY
jgi:hypothetical protein